MTVSMFYTPRHTSFLLVVLFSILLPFFVSAKVVDKIVAVVNDDIITHSELEAEASDFYRKASRNKTGQALLDAIDNAREATLNSLIDQRLIQQRAEKMKVSVSEKEIDAALAKMQRKFGLDRSDFIRKLEQSGMTEKRYRRKLFLTILQNKVLSIDVRSKIVVTNEMVLNYYDANYTSKVDENSFYLLQMGFNWDDSTATSNAKEKALQTAQRVKKLVEDGQDFKKLAVQFSELPSAADGGDIGLFTLDDMALNMRSAIAELGPGDISEIVEIGSSYQFFKLLSGDNNAIVVTATYESVEDKIREKLYEEKLEGAYEDWVKNLKDKAFIQKL